MVPDSDGRHVIGKERFREHWINVPLEIDWGLMRKIRLECFVTGEIFEKRYGLSPKQIYASAISGAWAVYSRAGIDVFKK